MMLTWPNKSKCVVALSFDVDGVSSAMNQNPETTRLPSFMSMREYGPSVATPRILDMLDEYGIKASFFIPGFVAETHETLVKNIYENIAVISGIVLKINNTLPILVLANACIKKKIPNI